MAVKYEFHAAIRTASGLKNNQVCLMDKSGARQSDFARALVMFGPFIASIGACIMTQTQFTNPAV